MDNEALLRRGSVRPTGNVMYVKSCCAKTEPVGETGARQKSSDDGNDGHSASKTDSNSRMISKNQHQE